MKMRSSRPLGAVAIDVCALDDLSEGTPLIRGVRKGISVVLIRIGDHVVALSAKCPHRGAPLEMGTVRGIAESNDAGVVMDEERHVLICPWHHWEWSLSDGRDIYENRHCVRIFKSDVVDGRVRIHLAAATRA